MNQKYLVAIGLAFLAYMLLRPKVGTTTNTVGDITTNFGEAPFVEENNLKDIKGLLSDLVTYFKNKPAEKAEGRWVWDAKAGPQGSGDWIFVRNGA